MMVWISIESRYSWELSENTGIPKLIISSSKIGALTFVDLSKITISLYWIFLNPLIFLSNTWKWFSIKDLILLATNLASTCMSSTLSSAVSPVSSLSCGSSVPLASSSGARSSFSFKSITWISVSNSCGVSS